MMTETLSSRYDPHAVEGKWYEYWRSQGLFRPSMDKNRPAFSMVLPPPNVTGVLHIGHALNTTWQDILARFHRMQGDNTLWLPGTDHAGIATQVKVEEQLRQEGTDRKQIGRDAFIERVWQWKEQYGGTIEQQLAKLGASVDWDRKRFTMDEGLSRAVTEVFVRLYEDGLIYRGQYIINWCVSCHTALSDIEVDHADEAGQLTYIRYPLTDGTGFITIATTRPETIFGDTAVAVHPDDPRYKDLQGKSVEVPLSGRVVPIITDRVVDPEYGTGAVKVTPAHDPNDFGMGERHGLLQLKVINEVGQLTELAGKYAGMDRLEARRQVVEDLQALGAVEKIEDLVHAVGHCERCGTVIEPLLSQQWFVRTKPLADAAVQAVQDQHIQFVPERFEKIYMNWMDNIHDWCISRQLWWGHRIPAYYCDQCQETIVSRDPVHSCPVCAGPVHQDEDVLDTWFSSALWPFSTLGWPDETEDLATFYPTSVLSTGYDIIFFWVARMIMQGVHFTGEEPFHTVLLHGLVRDEKGRKMSKSLGNGVDPMAVVDQYGADALRLALVLSSAPGNDQRYSRERVEAGSHFANKVYNAVRFVLLSGGDRIDESLAPRSAADAWIRHRLQYVVRTMTQQLTNFEFGQAARTIYDFFWDDYCDWYIELAKIQMRTGSAQEKAATLTTLVQVGREALKLLHPFMPFVTEELFHALPHAEDSIMTAPWPHAQDSDEDIRAAEVIERAQQFIRAGRNLRQEMHLPPAQLLEYIAVAEDEAGLQAWQEMSAAIYELMRAGRITFLRKGDLPDKPKHAVSSVFLGGTLFLPLEGLVDLQEEAR
ncbi:MAG: valine--tRNA ligase, partial [Firmicutes bacterium]|nr:valine--tRNA ligase [Bacillota bacterium]